MREELDLTFSGFLGRFDEFGKGEWINVYASIKNDKEHSTFYCALISETHVAKSLEYPYWDLHIGNGYPDFSFHYEGNNQVATYLRHLNNDIEPLIVWREFHGLKEGYWDVSEEFRHYFRLYEDRKNGKFVLIDDNGDDEDVVLLLDKEVKIKLRLIKEFLAVKKIRLALFFRLDRFSNNILEDINIKEYRECKKGEDFVYSIGALNYHFPSTDTRKSQGFLVGKKLIMGLKDFEPKLFDRDEKGFADFFIGVDENGNDLFYTCDEEKLSNGFDTEGNAPNYLTPVYFKKEVLVKYYSQPNKYAVKDGYLQCANLWGTYIDNNHSEYVTVFLGDLGRLPYKEQLYWKSFNVQTSENISATAFRRSFLAEFTDPEKSDLFFKQKYRSFQEEWEKRFGWKFFRLLAKEDEHCFTSLHIPLTGEQKEFDEQVGCLAKIFIDSLNEKELGKGLDLASNSKGIYKLEKYLESKNVIIPGMLEFLRNLQKLRSTGVAHLKGSEYEKVKLEFSIGKNDLPNVFTDILVRCIWTLNTLESRLIKC